MMDLFDNAGNPLDNIEDVMASHDWIFERPGKDELTVHVTGAQGQYAMTFLWHEEHGAMQVFCTFDLCLPRHRATLTDRALRTLNETTWLGHFDVPDDPGVPRFRHTTLFRGMTSEAGTDHVADLIEIALLTCERAYGVFSLLAGAGRLDEDLLALALAESHGEA